MLVALLLTNTLCAIFGKDKSTVLTDNMEQVIFLIIKKC